MAGLGRVLVIGPATLRDVLRAARPALDVSLALRPLDGLWECGTALFDATVVSGVVGPKTARLVQCLRTVRPAMRIVVACEPGDEPLARQALEAGADDYLLEPIAPRELDQLFPHGSNGQTAAVPAGAARHPSETLELCGALRCLGDGPPEALRQLAACLRESLSAEGVLIQIDDIAVTDGEVGQPLIEEPIARDGRVVGRLCLGRRVDGAYSVASTARLVEYARLAEAWLSQARQLRQWQDLAWTDEVTGLRNRRYLEGALDERLEAAARERARLTVVLFDIDDLKLYNQRYGREDGDQLLRETGMLLQRCTRAGDLVVRYDGDEFAVVLGDGEKPRAPGSEHPRDPRRFGRRFSRALAQDAYALLGPEGRGAVTLRAGLASFPWEGLTRPLLLSAATVALSTAKQAGDAAIPISGRACRLDS